MTRLPVAKKPIALCLCILLATGIGITHSTSMDENGTADVDPVWEVRTTGTRGDPTLIRNVHDLQAMKNNLTADYELANDIDASATKEWNDGKGFEPAGPGPETEPIHQFTGSLDGRGYSINGLFIHRSTTDYVGLFGFIGSGGSVSNVGLVDADITGQFRTGGLVGMNEGGMVVNCYIKGNVSGDNQVGGLIGRMGEDAVVSDCYVMGNVSGATHIGGLVGRNDGWVKDCYATAGVSGTVRVGGLAGSSFFGVTEGSYATGNVTGTERVGGFVGYIWEDASVKDCYSTGTVTRSSGTNTYFGGFIGFNYRGKVTTSYSTGSVHYTGGSDPSNRGFCGHGDSGGNYQMTGNYWDTQTSRQTSTAGGATGRTTAQMKTKSTFTNADWDFEDVWMMIEHTTYPLLRGQDRAPPTANAGPDQILEVDTLMNFDGSASTDDMAIRDYTWTFNDGTGDITLHGIGPDHIFTVEGAYVVTLNVTDFADNWHTDTVNITVNPDTTPPVANAGSDQTVDERGVVTFDGSASTDNVKVENYTWSLHDGTGDVTLYCMGPTHTFMVPGVYEVALTVEDAAGNRDTDTMTVTVRDITPPVADAGPDRTVDEGGAVTFDGSASTDNVGIVNSSWAFHDRSGDITLYGTGPAHTFQVPGMYVVTLTVEDAAGYRDTDTMTVTVRDITPPVAHAGPDQTVDEGGTVTFDGSASTDNVGVVNFTWTFNDGTRDIVRYGVGPTHTFTIPGHYPVTLHVSDAAGLTHTDTMTVTVRDITPPVARAGPDQTADEGTTVTFDGSASTDNVGVVNYSWTFNDGTGNVTLYGMESTHTFTVPGVYEVTFTAVDAAGNPSRDTVLVTVRDITPPVADAGYDRSAEQSVPMTFDGSASTDNVGIIQYVWTFNDGTGDITLHGIRPDHAFPVLGIYTITLTVEDAVGYRDSDSMSVTVRKNGRFIGGQGTPGDPYLIGDIHDLQAMKHVITAHYALANPIDAHVTRNWNLGNGFEPVGHEGDPFTGSLEGRGRTISGLVIHRRDADQVGLFGWIGETGSVSGIDLVNTEVTGKGSVGGIAGHNRGTISGSSVSGSITGTSAVGGIVGSNQGGSVSNSHYNIEEVLINGGHHVTIGGLFNAQYRDWYAGGLTLDIGKYNSTLVAAGDRYEISNTAGLRDLLGFAGLEGYSFILVSDIDLSREPGLYIPYLAAYLHGDNHTVSNLRIDQDFASSVGFIGYSKGGSVSNIRLVKVEVTGHDQVGGLVGTQCSGSVTGSFSTGSVTGMSRVGGLVGLNDDGSVVSGSFSTASVSGTGNFAGGLAGSNNGSSISNSYATGPVTGISYVGGLVGHNVYGSLGHCYASGKVTGVSRVGGLMGYNSVGIVRGCFWDVESSEMATSAGGTGKTTTEMKNGDTFLMAGWEIGLVKDTHTRKTQFTWNIVDGKTNPFLSWEEPSRSSEPAWGIVARYWWALTALLAGLAVIPARNVLARRRQDPTRPDPNPSGPHPGAGSWVSGPPSDGHRPSEASQGMPLPSDPPPGAWWPPGTVRASQIPSALAGSGERLPFDVIPPPVKQKIRGAGIIYIALVLGTLQAVFTIPRGGGGALLVVIGGLVGAIGMLIIAVRNDFTRPWEKKGVLIGAVIFLLAFIIGYYQCTMLAQMDKDLHRLDAETEEINADNWVEKQSVLMDAIQTQLTKWTLLIVLLAATTGMIAVAPVIPGLLSGNRKRWFMLLPATLLVVTVILVYAVTSVMLQDFRDAVDDIKAAEDYDSLERAKNNVEKFDTNDAILGSQMGGVFNLINLMLAMILFHGVRPGVIPRGTTPGEKDPGGKGIPLPGRPGPYTTGWGVPPPPSYPLPPPPSGFAPVSGTSGPPYPLPLTPTGHPPFPGIAPSPPAPPVNQPPAPGTFQGTSVQEPAGTQQGSTTEQTPTSAVTPYGYVSPVPSVWICPQCGREMKNEYGFCTTCGFKRG